MELHDLTATQQASGVRSRDVSPLELVDHYLERIDRYDRPLGAFVTVLAEQARKTAHEAETQLARSSPDELPPLFGLPIAIKDLHPTAGIRTTMGSAALSEFVPDTDGVAVAAIRDAGAIVVGKTHAPEFGPCCYTQSDVAPEAVTPYDSERSASGSSGGSAAAVAARLVGVAHSSDGAGSTRTPAANCGLVGLKPSRGRVSPGVPGFAAFGTEGPIARTVEDAALLLDVMARPHAASLYPAPQRQPTHFREAASTAPGRLQIARYRDPGLDQAVDAECIAAYEQTSRLLESFGHEIVDIEHPLGATGMAALMDPLATVFAVGLATMVGSVVAPERRHLLRPLTQYFVRRGESTSGPAHAVALGTLAAAAASAVASFAPYDAVLTPTTTQPAMLCGAFRLDDGEEAIEAMWRWTAFTPLANFTGQPAISLPVHATPDGLPIGVLLTSALYHDDLLLSLGNQLEEALSWQHRRPDLTRLRRLPHGQ